MSSERKRMMILIGLVAVVGGLVLADRLTAGDDTESTPDVRTEYARQAELVARMQAFIDEAPRWRDAHDEAAQRWRELQSRLIAAPTAELANARLQQKISTIVNELGLTLNATSAPSVRTPVEDQPLSVIGLTISIEASDPDALYALVDRLENMPDAWTSIRRMQALGPRRTGGGRINVDLDVESLAWITGGANAGS